VSKCLKGDLVRGRTVLLVTHNVALVTPVADYVVSLGGDGRVVAARPPSETVLNDRELVEQITHKQEALQLDGNLEDDEDEHDQKAPAKGAKLVVEEEVQQGHISWNAIKLFTSALSGWPAVFWTLFLAIRWSVRHLIFSHSADPSDLQY
jgi:ABC-type multidrug transport system ATPase subunit